MKTGKNTALWAVQEVGALERWELWRGGTWGLIPGAKGFL